MNESRDDIRLPPPAFPPGSRRHRARNSTGAVEPAADQASEDRADPFISPDDPLPDRGDPFRNALISPDEPLPERHAEMTGAFADALAATVGEGEVVGMNMDPHIEHEGAVSGGDPHVVELMEAVAKLAAAVRQRGEAGLRATPDMTRFESTLRAYCVGYLAGRRAEEPPEPEMEEALPTDG